MKQSSFFYKCVVFSSISSPLSNSSLMVTSYYWNMLSLTQPTTSIAFATKKAPSIGMDLVYILQLLVPGAYTQLDLVMREVTRWSENMVLWMPEDVDGKTPSVLTLLCKPHLPIITTSYPLAGQFFSSSFL